MVAACPPSRIRPDVKQALADQGVKVLSAGTGPNAADKVLLNRARQGAANGVKHFIVVSADATFAALAAFGELHVLAWDRQPVGKTLAKVATVHRIPRDRHTSTPASARPAAAPAVPRPAPVPQRSAPAPAASPSPAPDSPPLLRWGAAATAALFYGGLAFGAGSALGSRLVHLALGTAIRPRP